MTLRGTDAGPGRPAPVKVRLTRVKNTLLAFPTPIHQARYERLGDFNAEIAGRILALRESSAGQLRSNLGGWHSDLNLLQTLGDPYRTQLARMFAECVRAALDAVVEFTDPFPTHLSMDTWANVSERGDMNAAHIHPGCPWSGVYYVVAEPNSAGEIVFTDPRTAALMVSHPLNPFPRANEVRVVPAAGLMLVFPSFLYHSVSPYEGKVPRISVAFNLR